MNCMVTVKDLQQLHMFVNALVDDGISVSVNEVEEAALSGQIIDYLDEFNAFEALGGPEEVLDVDGLNTLFANYYITDTREHLLVENNGLIALSGSIFNILSIKKWDISTADSEESSLLDIQFSN